MKVKIQFRKTENDEWKDWKVSPDGDHWFEWRPWELKSFNNIEDAFDYFTTRESFDVYEYVPGIYSLSSRSNFQIRFSDENSETLVRQSPWKVGVNES